MPSEDYILETMINKSLFKQPFCHFGLRHSPLDYMYTEYPYLQKILTYTRVNLKDDEKFGKLIYTFLCHPSYFSLIDYDLLIDHFADIDENLQLDIVHNVYKPLLKGAIENVIKYNYGIYNLYLLKDKLPYISYVTGTDLDYQLLTILFDNMDNFPCSIELNGMVTELIISIYGSFDEFFEKNIDNFIIEV